MSDNTVSCGITSLDNILDGLRLGDNVVWQIDSLDDYIFFADCFVNHVLQEKSNCIYIRFATHQPIVSPRPGLIMEEVDPSAGFSAFTEMIHDILRKYQHEKYFLLDNLSALAEEWATDELLANFFQITCPFLAELETVAYFALTRGRHANKAIARIRDTTQVLIDVYRNNGRLYVHPLKVSERYSPQMFMPHAATGKEWLPVFDSGMAASLSQKANREPLRAESSLIAPWNIIYNKLVNYRYADNLEHNPEIQALKQEFSRMLTGRHAELNRMSDLYLNLEDLLTIRDRMIGSGRIGGKTTGMLLARKILLEEPGEIDFSDVLTDHDSFYIGSDVFFTFLVENNLFRQMLSLSRRSYISDTEFKDIEDAFLQGEFPADTMEQFQNMLDYYGQAPVIVRSSSLLEDSFGNAFAGKYRSEFCVNQGSPDKRMQDFMQAIKLVYASTISSDVHSYRLKRSLQDKDEQMAILVQRVAGMPYKQYFFPPLAGVAFSRNPYAWSDTIDVNKGIIRLVMGLGTRAVDRVSNDYPRMIAVSKPDARPDTGSRLLKYSQHKIDLLDISTNSFTTRQISDTIDDDYPGTQQYFSIFRDGYLYDPPYRGNILSSGNTWALTFNRLIGKTNFVAVIDEMLSKLDRVYDHPVDTEFTAAVDRKGKVRINLLQCRPLRMPCATDNCEIALDMEPENSLLKTTRVINGGIIDNISYIVFIDPKGYADIDDITFKKSIGRYVGVLNRELKLREGSFMLIGPGRWGSSNIDLGINASYADINNGAVLVELAWQEANFAPELSYGTHFFQDLVEDRIIYLPVCPEKPGCEIQYDFFMNAENKLAEIIPDNPRLEKIMKLIHIPAITGGLNAKVVADPHSHKALCYID